MRLSNLVPNLKGKIKTQAPESFRSKMIIWLGFCLNFMSSAELQDLAMDIDLMEVGKVDSHMR